jgi:hypothetical protein
LFVFRVTLKERKAFHCTIIQLRVIDIAKVRKLLRNKRINTTIKVWLQ